MKITVILITLLLSVGAYASDFTYNDSRIDTAEENLYSPINRPVGPPHGPNGNFIKLNGRTLFGPFINCEVYNHTYRPVVISHYKYVIEYRDAYGYIRTNVERPYCYNNCFMHPGRYLRLTGPRNAQNIIRVKCKAFARFR